MVSKASWRYSFYKAYAAIFYHYFNEIKALTISRGNFFFHTQKAFWLPKKKKWKKKENISAVGFTAEQAGKSETLHKMSLKVSSEPLEQQTEQLRLSATQNIMFNMKNTSRYKSYL